MAGEASDTTGAPLGSEVDLGVLARDWITLVQSELAAMAGDREAVETFQALLGLWAAAAQAMIPATSMQEGARDPAAGAAAVAAASGAGDAARADGGDAGLRRRIAALEQRIAELERAAGAGVAAGGGAGGRRKRGGGVGRKPAAAG